jgi:hypothetical protein
MWCDNENPRAVDGFANLELPDFNPCLTAKPGIQSIRRHKTSQNLVRQLDVSEDSDKDLAMDYPVPDAMRTAQQLKQMPID